MYSTVLVPPGMTGNTRSRSLSAHRQYRSAGSFGSQRPLPVSSWYSFSAFSASISSPSYQRSRARMRSPVAAPP